MGQRDDLLDIEGIDPVTEMALNSIGIRKFADFRGYAPETLAQTLREGAGIAIDPAMIAQQDWIGWAELLAAEAEKAKVIEETAMQASLPEEKSNEEVVLSIRQAQFSQFEKPTPSNAAMKFLRSEIECSLAGANALNATTNQIALCAQILAVDMATGEHKLLASQVERFQPGRTDCRFGIEFEAPKIGRYRLQIVAFPLEANSKIAFYHGPVLRVVP
jgi:hypothetical protein